MRLSGTGKGSLERAGRRRRWAEVCWSLPREDLGWAAAAFRSWAA